MTHLGDDLGVPATGRRVRITGISIARIYEGSIIEGWDNWDEFGLMQKLGVLQTAGASLM
jgi:predicted ester cyclase